MRRKKTVRDESVRPVGRVLHYFSWEMMPLSVQGGKSGWFRFTV